MQVLTGQYPTLYTHKFRVTFADLNTISTNYRQFSILTIPRAQQVVFVQMQQLVKWSGAGITGQTLRLWQNGQVGAANAMTGYFITHNNFLAPGNTVGTSIWVQPRVNPLAPTGTPLICNQVAPTELILTSRTTGANNNLFTAGETDIWITVIKTP